MTAAEKPQTTSREGNPTRTQAIAIVGPFPPIRSGVARHTEAVARAFERRPDTAVRRWGFSRQYPGFIYPGGSERDPDGAGPDGVLETIDGANPLSWHLTYRSVRDWEPDVVIMPAWTFAVAPALGWIARRLAPSRSSLCMIVHNAFDHEKAGWKDRFSSWQLGAADRYITHNTALAGEISTRFPGSPVSVFPHPVFDDVPTAKGALQKRSELELLFFGLVRPYKGLDVLLDAISMVERTDISLTVAGEFWQGFEEAKAAIKGLVPGNSVELISRYVSDEEAAELFRRSDAVVLPYRAVSGSGVVSLACHYRKPVIASDLSGFSEIVRHGETGWLFRAGDAADLAATIDRLEREQLRRAGEASGEFGESLNWDRFAELIINNNT